MAPPNVGAPKVIEVAREVSQAKVAREEKGKKKKKKKKKKVKLSQKEIDAYMKMAPPRPLTRFDPEEILQCADPDDPEVLEIGLKMMEIAESCAARHDAWQDKKKSIREQFLTMGKAFIKVTDDEAE